MNPISAAYLGAFVTAIVVIALVVVALAVLCVVSMWKIFKKAGMPGWASIIPFYNTVKQLQMVNRPLWWIVLYFVPVVNIVIAIMVLRRIAGVFGRGGWFTAGLLFLPFIFLPILAFGSAQYQNDYPAPRPMSEAVKWSLIAYAAFTAYMMLSAAGNRDTIMPLSVLNGPSGYATDGRYVYLNDTVIQGANPTSFRTIDNTDYAKDFSNIYYAGTRMENTDFPTFTVLDTTYAKDAHAVYVSGQPIDIDMASFAVYPNDLGYAHDAKHIYFDGEPIAGADVATFKVETGTIGSVDYDAMDKSHYYSYGAAVK